MGFGDNVRALSGVNRGTVREGRTDRCSRGRVDAGGKLKMNQKTLKDLL